MSQYVELMDRINVTDEMRQHILENIQKLNIHKADTPKVLNLASVKRWMAVAACFTVLLVGSIALPKILKPTETESPDTQVQNGIVEVASVDELSAAVGFEVADVTDIPFAIENQTYTTYWDKMAQITYTGEGQTAVYRKSIGTDDNSGDYNTYGSETELVISTEAVTLKGEDDLYTLAIWTDGEYAYSLKLTSGETETIWSDMIQGIQEQQGD